ncbi:TPA: thioredoxin domain-containing protein [Candidatus Micrarchaeota archaeon]|nr:MAG: hypothetical protein AUJ65_04320 [Candidatus Micrarchaeota archaeon CG1_02_51_15]HII38668.1 thioredoxin domain-containing protein [Candidatus Micrarchaeota archaeon]
MICLVALAVFLVLAVFSARYRPLAREAFDCVFRKMTLRPCESGLDERLKSTLVASVFSKSPRAAGALNRNFELFSWILTALMIASFAYSAFSAYNWVVYGDCNGPGSDGFCPFNAIGGEHISDCGTGNSTSRTLVLPATLNGQVVGLADAKVTVIEFGCFECKYTKEAEPIVARVLEEYAGRIRFVFKPFPIPTHNNSRLAEQAALCAARQDRFWAYKDELFSMQPLLLANASDAIERAGVNAAVNSSEFQECMQSNATATEVEAFYREGMASGLYGTPTFFINNRTLVGPKPFEAFEALIEEELKK